MVRRLRALFVRLGGLFNRGRKEGDLAAELESHLEMHVEDNVRSGMTAEEARRRALIKLGGVEQTKEEYRDRRGLPRLEHFLQDVRFGLRMLRKNPGFTLVALLTLALGIGANTAIFSVVNAVLLKPLPYPQPDRLMVMREYQIGGSDMSVNWVNFLDWRAQSRLFEGMAAYDQAHFTLTGKGEPVLLRGGLVSAPFFSVLGAQPRLGRVFTTPDDRTGAAATVVLTDDLWKKRCGSDPAIVGKALALNGSAYTVIGVLGPSFQDPLAPGRVDLYTPIAPQSGRWQTRDERGSLHVIGRLRAGVSLAAARAELDTIEGRLDQQFPKTNKGVRASVTPLYDERFGDVRPVLYTLLAAVGVVLLIACANVANLSIARSLSRRREFAIRRACGAGRGRVMGQLLVESTLLACLGGAAGLLPAWWSLGLIVRLAPAGIPRLPETRLDHGVLLFTLIVSVLTGILSGLAPGLEASRLDVTEIVKEGGTSTGRSPRRWQSGFLLAEIALAVVLVAASGLLVRSLIKTQQVDPGFKPDHVLVAELVLPASGYGTPAQRVTFYREMVGRLSGLPGVKSAGMVMCPPAVGHCWDWFYTVEGQPAPSPGKLPISAFNQASPTYFETMGVPLLAGRSFTEQDGAQSPPVVIVNQTFARRWWPNSSPLGKRMRLWTANGNAPYREIVGLVGDVKEDGLDAEQIPEVFMPAAQEPPGGMTFVMRTSVEPAGLVRLATGAVHDIDKGLPIERIQPMTRYLDASLNQRRFATLLVGLFGALALLLAGVGISGVTSYSVSQRTHEIGIRMALGARRGEVLRAVVKQSLGIAAYGIILGVVGALAATRLLSSMLFGIGASDPATFVLVCAALGCVTLLASYIPARRATRVDPMVALRHE
ncbi:MAG TPA: ABC transporter permease [Terriglobia bacterium]|nr:ABC transporter permease [Terriglobia bacterium]